MKSLLTPEKKQQFKKARALANENPKRAAMMAAQIGNAAIPSLIKLLKCGNESVNAFAVAALQQIGSEKVINALIQRINSPFLPTRNERFLCSAIQVMQTIPDPRVKTLLLQLLDSSDLVSAYAAEALAQVSPDASRNLIADLLWERHRFRGLRDTVNAFQGCTIGIGTLSACLVAICLLVLIGSEPGANKSNPQHSLILVTKMIVSMIVAGLIVMKVWTTRSVAQWSRWSNFYESAIKALEQIGEPQSIGVLAGTATDKRLFLSASRAILNLLPQVDTNHPPQLKPEEISSLNRLLEKDAPRLNSALIPFMVLVGNDSTLRTLEKIAKDTHRSGNIASFAQTAVPQLKQRLADQERQKTLLRAADVNEDTDVLLRAADQTTINDENQLLRKPD